MSFWKRLFKGGRSLHFFKEQIDGSTAFSTELSDLERIEWALKNPALLKVICLQCDLYSLGEFKVKVDEVEEDDHSLKKLLDNPNPFQTTSEFLWEFMFWKMLGVAQVYVDSNNIDRLLPNKMYLLKPYNLQYSEFLERNIDKLILSESKVKQMQDSKVRYFYDDGTSISFSKSQLLTFTDLGNPIGKLDFKSRVDALLKIIYNNEASMDAMNINIRYSGKFMVSGKTDIENTTKLPLGEDERQDIERKVLRDSPVQAVKSLIDIKRFVENAGQQKLDEAYLHTYFVIGSIYNIPRDVLEAYNSSTYENQEKARGSHVAYTLNPSGKELCEKILKHFKLEGTGITLEMSWENQPFMQIFAEQRAKVKEITAKTITVLKNAGVSLEDINDFLGVDFEYNEHIANENENDNEDENEQGDEDEEEQGEG